MLVHSFSQTDRAKRFNDYRKFAVRLGCEAPAPGRLSLVGTRGGIDLYLGWARGEARFLTM
jgi:hypothetical protein